MGSVSPPIPPATMPIISPSALVQAHISQTPPVRPSGRQPTEPRPIHLNIGALTHTHGSSLVRIGATTIVCGVRGEILPVSEIASFQPPQPYNLAVPNLELSTGCSPLHPANAAPSLEAQSISQRLLSLLLSSRLVRQEQLEITHTPELNPFLALPDGPPPQEEEDAAAPELKAFWVLYIDMVCLSHAGCGSVFDAAWLAMYAALRHTRLPRAVWDADAKQVFCSPDVREATVLRLRGVPVPLSFGVFVSDERAAHAATGETVLLRVEKSGGSGRVGLPELRVLVGIAKARRSQWQRVLQSASTELG
ncbi:hypothetical protein DV735_g2022, partial [Chaetothyriales sp. CBS 134920]